MTLAPERSAFRRGTPEDLDAVLAIGSIARSDDARLNQLRLGLAQSEVDLALIDGVPRGFALLHRRFFGHPFLELLVVAASHRRHGIGSDLVRHLLRLAGGSGLFTSTNQSNAPMRALLSKLGFEESGIIHNLDPGDPELVYFKRLTQEQRRL